MPAITTEAFRDFKYIYAFDTVYADFKYPYALLKVLEKDFNFPYAFTQDLIKDFNYLYDVNETNVLEKISNTSMHFMSRLQKQLIIL